MHTLLSLNRQIKLLVNLMAVSQLQGLETGGRGALTVFCKFSTPTETTG